MHDDYYCFKSTGYIEFDPLKGTKHFEPWWGLLICNDDIPKLYAYFLKYWGIELEMGSQWRTHISWCKGNKPQNQGSWGRTHGTKIEFFYSNIIRWDNGRHAWLDVYCPSLSRIRNELGMYPKDKYHLTIGRLKRPENFTPHRTDHR